VRYGHGARQLMTDKKGGVTGVVVRSPEGFVEIPARAVVLGCGGFEANPEWRTRYLGPNWDLARVRGTRHNTGDGIKMALDIGSSYSYRVLGSKISATSFRMAGRFSRRK